MQINQAGLDLIKKFEGFRAKPYLCPAGVWTVGYGTTIYPNGRKVAQADKPITKEQAITYLKADCVKFEELVLNMVKPTLNENQFSALVSFTYNCGAAALLKSTLLRIINIDPSSPLIEGEFSRWSKARVNGVMTRLDGLAKRRKAESELYFLPIN